MSDKEMAPIKFVQMRGSDVVFEIMQKIGYQFMTDFPAIGLPLCSGSSFQGYKSIIDETADVGLVSSEMPEDLAEWATKQGVNYSPVIIAYDAIAVIVHPSNPIKNLSVMDLREIFSGKVAKWKNVGWSNGGDIQVISQDPGRGTYVSWKKFVMGPNDHITLAAKLYLDNAMLVKAVAENPNAIAYLSTIQANEYKSNIISVNDIYPSLEAITKCKYPICRELQLLIRPNSAPEIQKLIEYCLAVNKGQKIIKDMGIASVE